MTAWKLGTNGLFLRGGGIRKEGAKGVATSARGLTVRGIVLLASWCLAGMAGSTDACTLR